MPAARVLIALKLFALAALVAVAVLWLAPAGGPSRVAHAQTWTLARTFLNPTPAPFDVFGGSVAALGSNVLVGAARDNAGATDAGAAYLFDANTGALLRTFLNPTPAADDRFGISVASVGGKVLVGAYRDDTGATDAGAAYLFDADTGALLSTFLNPTPAAGDEFSLSVAAVAVNVLVGAYRDDTGATDAGAAYLFDAGTGALLRTFLNPSPAADEWFGFSVAALGGNVLVGTARDDTGATDAGAAYLFDGASGALLRTFLNPSPAVGDEFGVSVTAVGGNVLVGAPGAPDPGAAYLFDASTGALLQTFSTLAAFDFFGASVAAVGDNVLVGAPRNNTGAPVAGAAYLFDASTGALLQIFLNPTPAADDSFGLSVAAVARNDQVGALDDTGANSTGAAYLFQAPAVGGIAELPAAAETPLEAPRSPGPNAGALAGIAAAAAASALGGLAGGVWWARRRTKRTTT